VQQEGRVEGRHGADFAEASPAVIVLAVLFAIKFAVTG
jgi:hypothetical protein